MITKTLKFGNQKGSSLNFFAQEWWGKEKNLSVENPVRRKVLGVPHNSEAVYGINSAKKAGKKEGVGGRNFCPTASVSVPFEKRKSGREVWGEFRFFFTKSNCGQPRHLPEYLEGRTPQKNTLFIKRRKNRARAK